MCMVLWGHKNGREGRHVPPEAGPACRPRMAMLCPMGPYRSINPLVDFVCRYMVGNRHLSALLNTRQDMAIALLLLVANVAFV